MPLSEVLAMYGYESGIDFDDPNHEVPENDSDSSDDLPQQIMENSQSPRMMTSQMMQSHSRNSPDDESRKVEVMDLVFYDAPDVPTMGSSRPLLRCNYFCVIYA